MPIPPPDELDPKYNPATEQSAEEDSSVGESPDIEIHIPDPETHYNTATEDAAAESDEDKSDD